MTEQQKKECCRVCIIPHGYGRIGCGNPRCECHEKKASYDGRDLSLDIGTEPAYVPIQEKVQEKKHHCGEKCAMCLDSVTRDVSCPCTHTQEKVQDASEFSGATFEQKHDHASEGWIEKKMRRFKNIPIGWDIYIREALQEAMAFERKEEKYHSIPKSCCTLNSCSCICHK